MAQLTREQLTALIQQLFIDNITQEITPEDLRNFADAVVTSCFVHLDDAITLNDASELTKGIVQLATQAEAEGGTDALKVITALRLKEQLNKLKVKRLETWAAGAWSTGDFAITADRKKIFTPKVDIANSAVEPSADNQYWKLVFEDTGTDTTVLEQRLTNVEQNKADASTVNSALLERPKYNEVPSLTETQKTELIIGEPNLFTATKQVDNSIFWGAGIQTINKFAPPGLTALLADSNPNWQGDRITITGTNDAGQLGRNAQEFFYKRRWYVCESSTNTQAIWLRNASIDVLDATDSHDAAIIAELENETGWLNNVKTLTAKSAKGDEYTSDTGYVYTCYSNDNKWRRIGEPSTVDLFAQKMGNYTTICNKLEAYDFSLGDYDAKADATGWGASDIKGWQGLQYYSEAQRALYMCVRNDATKTLWIKK